MNMLLWRRLVRGYVMKGTYRKSLLTSRQPISYAARGSHANYATPGPHYYVIPFHLLADYTDKGTLWDVTKNAYVYNFDVASQDLIPSAQTPNAPVEWFHFEGR